MLKWILACAAAGPLTACSSVDYSSLSPGRFSGSLFVMWVDEGGSSGDGTFLYVPDPKDPLIFYRNDSTAPGGAIRPGLMYTDGGSIPKIAQVFKGLSPWGYAPAYMIHDWLFVARHCIVDGSNDKRFDEVRNVNFNDSAKILGEAIRTLVKEQRVDPNDVAASGITGAVGTTIARNLWDKQGACAELQVGPKDIAAAESAIPGSTRLQKFGAFRLEEGASAPPPTTGRAKIVARVSF